MIFQYYHDMDREFSHNPHVPPEAEGKTEVDLSVKDVGMSVPLGIAAGNVEGVNAKIRSGASNLELGFPGAVRGNRQSHTPGMWGHDQRQALREIARANDITFTTHASYGIPGMAGQDQQGNFSNEQRQIVKDEVKRAIEFARDTAGGGSVVVHTGEYSRPFTEEGWNYNNGKKNPIFRHYDEEEQEAIIRLVDDRTGQVLQQIRKNQEVARAVWRKADHDYNHTVTKDYDQHLERFDGHALKRGTRLKVKKGQYIDYEGNPLDIEYRVPEYDKEKETFKVDSVKWDEFEREAMEWNEYRAREKKMSVEQFMKEGGKDIMTPEEAFLWATTKTQEMVAKGWAGNYAQRLDKQFKNLERLKSALENYEKIEKDLDPKDAWKLIEEDSPLRGSLLGKYVRPEEKDYKMPTEIIKEAIGDTRKDLWSIKEMVTGQLQQAKEQEILRSHITTPKKYALDRSHESYAEAGIYAMENSKHTQKPIVITMENIFPESYGSHPDELRSLVQNSRGRMVDMLKRRGYSENEAKQKASTHIKTTLDTGHLNMWRKYWVGDPSKGKDENDKQFNKWMLDKVEMLAKDGLIGNVHLTDNYGYQDDHLAPGQGNTPVKQIANILKKHGYDQAWTVEPGADASTDQGDFYGLAKTWRHFGSPVYGMGEAPSIGAPARGWSDIQHSYFGYNSSPYFVFGAYSPSNDWQLWSQTPME